MYRKKRRSWTKHVDFMLLDVLCMQLAFVISYIIRFGTDNPYTDGDYRTLAIAFLFIDFFVEIVSDSFKNVLKRGYVDEFIATCRHVILVELIVTFYLFTTQTGSVYSRLSYYIMVPFYIVTDYAARVIWKKILRKIGFNSAKKSLLIIAPEKILRETLQIVSADRRGYAKVTAVSLDTDLKGKNICGIPIVADRDGIIEYACGEWVDEVFIPPCAESEYPNELVGAFLEMGIAVHTGITKYGSFPAGRENWRIYSYYHKYELCRVIKTSGETSDGHCRRSGRMSDHPADHHNCGTNDLHQFTWTDLLCTGKDRTKRKKIQNV